MKKNFIILVADDNKAIAMSMIGELEKKKYVTKVDYARDGKETFEMLKKNQYSGCFLDVKMPYMTGLEVIQKCKEEKIKLPPTYLVTGEMIGWNEINQLGVKGVIAKGGKYIEEIIKATKTLFLRCTEIEQMELEKEIQKYVERFELSIEKTSILENVISEMLSKQLWYDNIEKVYREVARKHNRTENEVRQIMEQIVCEEYAKNNFFKKIKYQMKKEEINAKSIESKKTTVLSMINMYFAEILD